jgi:hypothetical protein
MNNLTPNNIFDILIEMKYLSLVVIKYRICVKIFCFLPIFLNCEEFILNVKIIPYIIKLPSKLSIFIIELSYSIHILSFSKIKSTKPQPITSYRDLITIDIEN